MTSEDFIRRTFELARQGLGTTWPNPLVGAVIVKNNQIIAEGFHRKSGEAHAELDAINNAKESLEGATIYVNLEPCCHTNKKTPPCAQRLITEKFKKVVICNLDPNPSVNGKGVELLRSNGIEVEHGILAKEGEELNEVFFHAQLNKRPFVHLKLATTLDGRIALPSGESKWITGELARSHVHLLRSQNQAIMVGGETIRKDHPKLNVRLPDYSGPQPKKVIISASGNIPAEQKIDALVYSSPEEAMKDLYEQKIISVFVEGGAKLATSLITANLIDRVSLYLNPSFLGAGASALGDLGLDVLAERPHLKNIKSEWIGGDFYLTGRL